MRSTAILTLLMASTVAAQVRTPAWRKVGSTAVDLNLASPATGAMKQVWFSDDGATLYASSRDGKVFATNDFETWRAVVNAPPAPQSFQEPAVARKPEDSVDLVSASANTYDVFALGRNLSRTNDGGRSWINLTGYRSQSVIGSRQRSVATNNLRPDEIVIANDHGVWRSMDGGASWTGLNVALPNLPVRRILGTPSGTAGVRILADGMDELELRPGNDVWEPVPGSGEEASQMERYSRMTGETITAVNSAGDTVLAGSSAGHLWYSWDGGKTFKDANLPVPELAPAPGRVERIWLDPAQPSVALAAVSGPGPHVLLTSNRGYMWNALDSPTLPNVSAYSVAGDRATGAVYVATDQGVFYGHADLEFSANLRVTWQKITAEPMPAVRATDVRLDATGTQLYIALDGYGLYRAPAPHQADGLRIVNAADSSSRAAAPGSVLSVIGMPVSSVRGADLDYPILAVLGNASQVQVPFEAVGPNVSLTLQTSAGTQRRGISVLPVSPAILTGSDGVPVLADADSGLAIDGRNPAHSSARIQIMATGLGKVRPDWPTGRPAPDVNPPVVAATVRAMLDGKPIEVTRATLAPQYVGFYVVEVKLPAVLNAGTSVLSISADGLESNRVQIVIEP
ncbi:MAG TPA: hypothetical protein VML19_18985 [Verrucomicrobiae bacterium]|nr:hypothetical protein [Verrucomicrobiae bacterium]